MSTWILIADLHFPNYSTSTWRCALSAVEDLKPSGLVLMGDQLDNRCISHHTAGKPLFRETGQYANDTRRFNRDILEPLEAALPADATKVWLIGNHDFWEQELVEASPELEGTVERPILLGLAERGWTVVPNGELFKHGKLSFCHGDTLSGMIHSKKAAEVYCTNLVYGHFHTLQSFTKILAHDPDRKWTSTCIPIVGSVHQGYLHGKPTGWLNGFAVVEWIGPNFNLYPVIVTNGRCSYGGRVYPRERQPRASSRSSRRCRRR